MESTPKFNSHFPSQGGFWTRDPPSSIGPNERGPTPNWNNPTRRVLWTRGPQSRLRTSSTKGPSPTVEYDGPGSALQREMDILKEDIKTKTKTYMRPEVVYLRPLPQKKN
ncbi:Hypothetical predicted protein [Mytilus galloprovincialis]|uniref:Uncharacterized protein n=1 Tax=Mytilus galloprovincialis TaxID=29158 RepID=A0A8B6H1Z8_MYTGA|nr:Hypothetical predicted protein [Mytilus galloprovincialis]